MLFFDRFNPRLTARLFMVCCLVLSPCGFAGMGRNIKFNHLGIEDGLSQGFVHAILQDSRGIMWFGTQDGLNRYDGYEFITYKHESFNPHSLAHSEIDTIFEQRNGAFWVVTQGILNRFDRQHDRFTRFYHDEQDPGSIGKGPIGFLFEDRDGNLWIGTDTGMDRYLPETGTFAHYAFDAPDQQGGFFTMVQDPAGTLWIVSRLGLHRFDKKSGNIETVRGRGDLDTISERTVLLVDDVGVLWLITEKKGLVRYDPRTHDMDSFIPPLGSTREQFAYFLEGIIEDQQGFLWMTSGNGLLVRFDKTSETFRIFSHDPEDPGSLSANAATAVFEDRQGQIWVTTTNGLNLYDRKEDSFFHYYDEPNNPKSLHSNSLDSVYEDQTGTLWFTLVGDGLAFFNGYKQKFRHYLRNLGEPKQVQSNIVWTLAAQGKRIWIGTEADGAVLFNPETGRIDKRLNSETTPRIQSPNVRSLHRDNKGRLWIASVRKYKNLGGLDLYDPKTDTVRPGSRRYCFEPAWVRPDCAGNAGTFA
ncbi:MAG: two-component regulator propeller domain-containing protein, partial [Acidobacteriota bacterium]|nr:two-component regulator propeller domain-containing protein [Acidobacteriota bacterium]